MFSLHESKHKVNRTSVIGKSFTNEMPQLVKLKRTTCTQSGIQYFNKLSNNITSLTSYLRGLTFDVLFSCYLIVMSNKQGLF